MLQPRVRTAGTAEAPGVGHPDWGGLTPGNGSGRPRAAQGVSVTFRSSRAPSSSGIPRTLSRNPSQEYLVGKPLYLVVNP